MQELDNAIAAIKAGNFQQAEQILLSAHARAQRNFDIAHMLGIVSSELGKISAAESFFKLALSIDTRYPPLYQNYGLFLSKTKRFAEAIKQFDKALQLHPGFAPVYSDRGNALKELGKLDEAIADHGRAIGMAPNFFGFYNNRGNALNEKKRYEEALSDFNNAIRINPNFAESYCGRGDALFSLKKFDEARSNYDKALSLKPTFAEAWLGRGNILAEAKRYIDALSAYEKALSFRDDLAGAWAGQGNVFAAQGQRDKAILAYQRALSLKPDLPGAWLGLGNIKFEMGSADEACAAYRSALSHDPRLAEAWYGLGNALSDLKQHAQANDAFSQALSITPDLKALEGARLYAKFQICDWTNYTEENERLQSSVKSGLISAAPFTMLAFSDSPEDQLKCAQIWAAEIHPQFPNPAWSKESRRPHGKIRIIRISYISSDFRVHPVSQLMAEIFELHDRAKFEVTALSIGSDDKSSMRERLQKAFDKFVDCSRMSDAEIVELISRDQTDILVDLSGFTRNSRTNIFAARPAPIQVNYLGYAGSMGAPYYDYLIADRIVIPPSERRFYSEKIVSLPNSFMPHDRKGSPPSHRTFQREDFGLPSEGFVFCCFNNTYKLNPNVLKNWATILQATKASVLWISELPELAKANLLRELERLGIDASRVIFARRVDSHADHLARHQLADLFLDTLPYNAHTTTMDALWAGLPVLTQTGSTFAGRVAASLLTAAGLPELITASREDYVGRAIELAQNPQKLLKLREQLAARRPTAPLFDSSLFTRDLEAAYEAMFQRHQDDLPPADIELGN